MFEIPEASEVVYIQEAIMRNTSELALHLKELISSFRGYNILREIGLYQPLYVLMCGDLREKM